MLHGGGRKLGELREIKGEVSLRELLQMGGSSCLMHCR